MRGRGEFSLVGSKRIVGAIGAILAIAAQLFLSPLLNVGGATPSFTLAFFLPYALLSSPSPKLVLAVILGLAFDFTQGTPLGAHLLILTLLSLAIPFFTSNLDSTNQGGQVFTLIIFTVLANALNIVLVGIATPSVSILSLIQSGALFEILLDGAIAILFYVILLVFNKDKRSLPTILGS